MGPASPVGMEPPDDACDPQVAQDVAERHRRDDVAAARVEEDDSLEIAVLGARLQEIDESLGRRRLDHPVGDDHVRAPRAAAPDFAAARRRNVMELGAAEAGSGARAGRRHDSQREGARDRQRTVAGALVGGDGLEPPTLSV